MIGLRTLDSLGKGNLGWLTTSYHFSFSQYYEPKRIHWGALRVWNNDTIEAHSGFPMHSHDNMEIITYVYQGALTHEDNLGNKGKTKAGQVQIMSAGSGITHSEYNLEAEETKLFQIWLFPSQKNVMPRWETQSFPKATQNGITVLASGLEKEVKEGALKLHTNGRVVALYLKAGETITLNFEFEFVYLVASKGNYSVNDLEVRQADGVAIKKEDNVMITAHEELNLIYVETN